MSYLLDVNMLVSLFDGRHVNHDAAHYWFGTTFAANWATCSITEAGCVRVLSNPARAVMLVEQAATGRSSAPRSPSSPPEGGR